MELCKHIKIGDFVLYGIAALMILIDFGMFFADRADIALTGILWGLFLVWKWMPNKAAIVCSLIQFILTLLLLIVVFVNIKYDGLVLLDSFLLAQLWLQVAYLSNVNYTKHDNSLPINIVRVVTVIITGALIYDSFAFSLHLSLYLPLWFFIIIRIINRLLS